MENEMIEKQYNQWIDLEGTETERTYHYPDGFDYTVNNPEKLYIKRSGSHKVIDGNGRNHYITPGWRAFSFEGDFDFNLED